MLESPLRLRIYTRSHLDDKIISSWIEIKNDCHATWLATIRNLSRGWRSNGFTELNACKPRQLSVRVDSFSFHVRAVNTIVKRKSFVKLVDDRDNCASESWVELNPNLRWKKKKRKKRLKISCDEPDSPDVRINYANVHERLSGIRSLFRLGNIYIDTHLRKMNFVFLVFSNNHAFVEGKNCKASLELVRFSESRSFWSKAEKARTL